MWCDIWEWLRWGIRTFAKKLKSAVRYWSTSISEEHTFIFRAEISYKLRADDVWGLLITVQFIIFCPLSWGNSVPLWLDLARPDLIYIRTRFGCSGTAFHPLLFSSTRILFTNLPAFFIVCFRYLSLCQILPHELCVTKPLHVIVSAAVCRYVHAWSEI
jgi:hypothetical protein